jgi:hypothetical protein
MKFQNTYINKNLIKYFSIKIYIAAFNINIYYFIRYNSFFTKVIFNIF